MNGCLVIKETKIFSKLKKYYGNDESKALSALLSVVTDNEFTQDFLDYRKKKRKTEVSNLETANDVKTLNDIISYNNLIHPDGNDTVLEYTDDNVKGYSSAADRHFCQKIIANEIIDIFTDELYNKHLRTTRTKVDYVNKIRRSIGNYLVKRISEVLNITEDEFYSHFNDERADGIFEKFIDANDVYGTTINEDLASDLANIQEYCNIARELLGKKIDIQEENLIATIEEMINITSPSTFDSTSTDRISYSQKFFDSVFRDPRLSTFRDEIKDSTINSEEDAAQESEDGSNDENPSEDTNIDEAPDTFDESFRIFDNHDGQYKTFMIHLGENIKNYFNRLKKCKTASFTTQVKDGKEVDNFIYDTNNAIGIADTMSASECAMMMYTHADYTNVDAMIESVKRIAEQVPGFEGFIQFYRALQNNRDFANEVYCTFGKMVIAKKETRIVNGETIVRITNNATNRLDALTFEYLNSFRSSFNAGDESVFAKQITDIKTKLDQFGELVKLGRIAIGKDKRGNVIFEPYNKESILYQKDKLELVQSIASALKVYFPNITTSVLLNYSANAIFDNKIDDVVNIGKIVKELDNLLEAVRTTRSSYIDKQYRAAQIRDFNKQLRKEKNYNPEDIQDSRTIWNEELISDKGIQVINTLAKYFVPYAVVKTQLNSRNASGKLSSDVINNSMISNLKNILESELNIPENQDSPLRHFAAYKFRGKQYNFSNILLETVKNGVIINRGLFRKQGDTYVPTEYADKLLRFTLFNGVQDTDTGNSVLYSGMSRGDYAATAMVHFFKGGEEGFADYLLRTPSDAPKNYIMTAPRYSLKYKSGNRVIDFWEIENRGAFDTRVQQLLSNIPVISEEEVSDDIALTPQTIRKQDTVRLLSGETVGQITINKHKHLDKETNRAQIHISYQQPSGTIQYIVEGDYKKNDNGEYLTDAKLVGVIDFSDTGIVDLYELRETLQNKFEQDLITGKQLLTNGERVTRTINKNHPIFQQMLRTATQEFQDAATAIDVIFEHENGRIKLVNGNPVLASWLRNEKDIERRLCANYHYKKNIYTDHYFDSKGILHEDEHEETGLIQNLWTKVVDEADENGNPIEWHYEKSNTKILSGNVFSSDRFTLNGRNYLAEVFGNGIGEVNDGSIHLLYGGVRAADSHLHINDDGDVELTVNQQKLVEAKLVEFINDYVAHTIDKVSEFDNLLDGIPHSNDDIAEFILNYRLAYFNCNDLLEGDSKYYKSAQDFLKRAKEIQGSGVPYAIVDYSKPMFGQDKTLAQNSIINSEAEQDFLKSLNDCKQYRTFRAVTIKNTIRQDENTKTILLDKLTEKFIEEGLSADAAKAKATKMMNRYKKTKVNDAQSYITFEEWIRRISARGQYYKYKPLIERILDRSKPISAEDIEEFIQVQKNFYYDQYYDERLRSMRPRQIKNAEFVLVPRFIEGTQLEQVYDLMIKHGIDQLNTEETSKAGKTNILTLWDNDGNITEENVRDFEANVGSSMEVFDYNYLYTQQETPQHINDYNKAALQIMKKILDNIDSSSPLKGKKDEFLALYAENIYDSFATLMQELNVPLDENGNILIDENGNINGLDYSIFMKRLEDEMVRLGLDSNMLDFVTLADNAAEVRSGDSGFGLNTKMPAYFNSTRTKLESVAQAVINNRITRQKLPGFHAAQITNVGWKSNGESSVSYSKELQYHPQLYIDSNKHEITEREYNQLSNEEKSKYKKGRIAPWIEIMLPPSAFGLNRNSDRYNDIRKIWLQARANGGEVLSDAEIEQKVDEAMLEDLQALGLDKFIGYRIPTEGKQSMAIMKVVGFTDDALGSTIVVPDAWVAQTGSDFDIDSVYGIQYATYKDKDGRVTRIKYDDKKSMRENSREARMNKMLDDMIEILSSDDSLEENLSQSQFSDIIDSRDRLMSPELRASRENRSCFDFFDQSDYHEDASSGAKLKARSVIRDTFCSLCNTMKPTLTHGVDIVYKGDSAKFEELQKRFDVKDEDGNYIGRVRQIDDEHIMVTHKMFGWSNDNHNVVNSLLTVYSSETTAHILDAIKEGAIPNVNDFTFDVYKLFPDLGSDYDTCVGFMMQPGVSEIVKAYNRNKSIYASDYTKPIDGAIKAIADKLGLRTEDVTVKELRKNLDSFIQNRNYNVLDAEKLADRLKRSADTPSSEDLLWDYAVIKQYEELAEIASKINKLAGVCKPDKFGAKQTIFQTRQIFQDIADILKDDNQVFRGTTEDNFLTKLYPGINTIIDGNRIVIDNYLKYSDNNSIYPSLNNFLKYSSAVSIKINQILFITQHPNFINQINSIVSVMSGENPRVSEDTYNAFEKYYLADIYKTVGIIGRQISYEYGKGIVETNGQVYDEIRRIFGYDKGINFEVERNGAKIPFETSDINHPSEEDIDAFAQLSPAQKVLWIQQHFKDGLITKFLKVNLVNDKSRGSEKYGTQTVEFIEDGQDREYIYDQFRKTFMNSNPFLAMTAMDIIKYAFVVEGYNMKQTAVNKVIDNDVLVNSQGLFGTGIVEGIDQKIKSVISFPMSVRTEELLETFVRSHSNMKEISHCWINKTDRRKYVKAHKLGFCTIETKDYNIEFLVNKGFGYTTQEPKKDEKTGEIITRDDGSTVYETVFHPNKYVKIKYSKKEEVLYKIKSSKTGNVIYLSPLNPLQENESGVWSANSDNWKYQTPSFYDSFVKDIEYTAHLTDITKLQEMILEYQKQHPETNAPQTTREATSEQNVDFDIYKNEGNIRTAIEQHFTGIDWSTLYLESPFLGEHIKEAAGMSKELNGNLYHIKKIDTREAQIYVRKYREKIPDRLKDLAPFIQRVRDRAEIAGHAGSGFISDIFTIDAMNNPNVASEVWHSDIVEEIAETDRAIRKDARNSENEAAEKYVRQMDSRDVESTVESVQGSIDDVVISQAEALHAQVDKLLKGNHGFEFFEQVDGEWLTMTDPRTMVLVKGDPAIRRQYLKNILQAQHLINIYKHILENHLTEETKHLELYFNKIREDIRTLENADFIKKSEELFVTEYLAKISNNPNIQRNIMSLMDGWFSTNGLVAAFDDLQNTANPLVQIITSDCMADIRAKELQAEERIREFKKEIARIKEEAVAKGLTINMDNIIDEYGKFITAYDDKFLEDLDSLRDTRDKALEAYKNSTSDDYDKAELFEKVLKARHEYNKWKLKHTNQEVDDEYYYKYNNLVESMINKQTGKFYDIYVAYAMLNDQLANVLSHSGPDGLDAYWEEKKNNILRQINNLRSNAYIDDDGLLTVKEDLEEYQYSSDPRIRRRQIINNATSYILLDDFITEKRKLEEEYFDKSERFGFREQLNKYLEVVRHYEESAIPPAEYEKDEKYIEAKNWIRRNAYKAYKVDVDEALAAGKPIDVLTNYFDKELNEDNIPLVLNAALEYFKKTKGNPANKTSSYKRIARDNDAIDEQGIIDGRKLSEGQRRTIKLEQETRFGIGESNALSTRGIIHISSKDDTVYTREWYDGFRIDSSITNPDYLDIVKEINLILRKAINHQTGEVRVSDNLTEDDINNILIQMKRFGYDVTEQEFDEHNRPKKYIGTTPAYAKKLAAFIKEYVDTERLTDDDRKHFEAERSRAELKYGKNSSYYRAWCKMNYEWDETTLSYVPNHLFWGTLRPKEQYREKFTDKTKTTALRVTSKVFTVRPNRYYWLERDRIINEYGSDSKEFNEWVNDNHIYNPNTHALQPIPCWTMSEPNEYMPGEWEPTWRQTERAVDSNYINPSYKKGLGVAANFKTKEDRARLRSRYEAEDIPDTEFLNATISDGRYDKPYNLNSAEEAMKDYLQETLAALATTKKAKEYIERGYLPTRSIKEPEAFHKRFLRELAKGFGYVERNGESYWEPNLNYDTDYVPNMPMLHQLTSKESVPEPRIEDFEDTEKGRKDFEKAKQEWEEHKEENIKKNREIHKSLVDRDWESVMEDFIRQAAHFNAIQDNKNQLYFGLKLLSDYMVYESYSGKLNRIGKDDSSSRAYEKRRDDKLYKQYQNWLHRVIFDQYKEHGTSNKAHIMNILQSITSMNYMTLNIRGGVANVTVGESNILGEAFAQEYFGKTNWIEGKGIWTTGITSYLTNMYSEISNNLADAIIKGMHIVDYDEHTGVVSVVDMEEWSKRIRDLGFAPLSMGEHFMQNSAMFSMMLSHKVVNNPNYGKPGEPKYLVQNLHEYIGQSLDIVLRKILDNTEYAKFEAWVENKKKYKNEIKDYVWYKRNLVQDYVIDQLSKEQRNKFEEELDKYRKQREEEFNKAPNLYSQFKVGEDGRMAFKDDSLLAEMHILTKNNEVSDAYKALGKFKQRVISVNKKIHGHYGKLDAAQIESKWWGGLVMQYHKHIVPGILKRWRVKGYFNEERGTIEKGSRIALFDFLKLPIKQIAEKNNLNDGQTETLKGIQNVFHMITDYCNYLKLNAKVMEQSERDNVLRNLGDVAGVVGGLLLALLLRLGWDDDDDSFVYNFGLYQADRLSSEAFMWNPYGAMAEAKKLWSNPVAVQSIINDIFSGMGVVAGMIMEGEEYDPYYHSGRFAGQHKLGVYVERRIPYWRNYIALRDIADNNHYYKMGDNMIGLINVKDIAHTIKGDNKKK